MAFANMGTAPHMPGSKWRAVNEAANNLTSGWSSCMRLMTSSITLTGGGSSSDQQRSRMLMAVRRMLEV